MEIYEWRRLKREKQTFKKGMLEKVNIRRDVFARDKLKSERDGETDGRG